MATTNKPETEYRIGPVVNIMLHHIDNTKYVSRHSYGADSWQDGVGDLAESIARRGQFQPVLVVEQEDYESQLDINPFVDPRYDLVVGHRRFEAAKVNGVVTIEARVLQPRPTEIELHEIIIDENVRRQDWTPVERAEEEARLKREKEKAGLVSTSKNPKADLETYAVSRSYTTGESARTINQLVALGEATPALKLAVDTNALSVTGGYKLAQQAPDVQVHVVKDLAGKGVTKATPKEVAATIVEVKRKHGVKAEDGDAEFTPTPETVTLAKSIRKTDAVNDALMEVLRFYADDENYAPAEGVFGVTAIMEDGGHRAQELLTHILQIQTTLSE